jgi:hypothetical protein
VIKTEAAQPDQPHEWADDERYSKGLRVTAGNGYTQRQHDSERGLTNQENRRRHIAAAASECSPHKSGEVCTYGDAGHHGWEGKAPVVEQAMAKREGDQSRQGDKHESSGSYPWQ